MKKFDIVETHRYTDDMFDKNIKIGTQGIVVDLVDEDNAWVLFLDEENIGDYAYARMCDTDVTTISRNPSQAFVQMVEYMLGNFDIHEKGFRTFI